MTDDTKGNNVCVNCQKESQKEIPSNSSSSGGGPCEGIYASVTLCMKKHKGQISPCAKQWDEFRVCHQKKGNQRGSEA